jgi:hypothetical protein
MRYAIGTLILLFALSGCAVWPLGEADCKGVNWQQRGYADGYGGHPPQYLRLARECTRFGVEVPEAEYFKGWHAGYDEWYRLIGSMDRRRP